MVIPYVSEDVLLSWYMFYMYIIPYSHYIILVIIQKVGVGGNRYGYFCS